MQPYGVSSPARTIALTVASLTAALAAPVPGVRGMVASVRTPDNHMTVLKGMATARLYLQARYQVASGALASGAQVIQVNGGGRIMTLSPRAARAFPTRAHADVNAWVQMVANGPWTPTDVLGADWVAGTVTVQNPAGSVNLRVNYTFGDGEIYLLASRPYGSSGGEIQLYNVPARSLHETNQADTSAAPVPVMMDKPIPQGFTLGIAVRAASAVYFDGMAQHEVMLSAYDLGISVSDPVMLADLAERQLKGQ